MGRKGDLVPYLQAAPLAAVFGLFFVVPLLFTLDDAFAGKLRQSLAMLNAGGKSCLVKVASAITHVLGSVHHIAERHFKVEV